MTVPVALAASAGQDDGDGALGRACPCFTFGGKDSVIVEEVFTVPVPSSDDGSKPASGTNSRVEGLRPESPS